MCIAILVEMMLKVDQEQAQVLREVLEGTLSQLRVESARADTHDYRAMLHHREQVVEMVLKQLTAPAVSRAG